MKSHSMMGVGRNARATKTWTNRAFSVDDEALYSLRGEFVVKLDAVADQDDGILRHGIAAAVCVPGVSIPDIEQAMTYAIDRARGCQPNWDETRIIMIAMRRAWPGIAEACRRAVSDESTENNPFASSRRLKSVSAQAGAGMET